MRMGRNQETENQTGYDPGNMSVSFPVYCCLVLIFDIDWKISPSNVGWWEIL